MYYKHSPSISKGMQVHLYYVHESYKKCFSAPICGAIFPPYSYIHHQQELPQSHGGALYTQCPWAVRAKCFILSRQGFACWWAPLYSQLLHINPESRYKCLMNSTSATHLYLTAFSILGRKDIIPYSSAAGSWTACLMLNLRICEDRRWQIRGKLWSQRENRQKMNLSYILGLYNWMLNLLCWSKAFVEILSVVNHGCLLLPFWVYEKSYAYMHTHVCTLLVSYPAFPPGKK